MIGPLLRRKNPERDILITAALDHPRGPHPARVRVEQQADHHRRVISRPAAPVLAIGAIERIQIHLADGIDHEPRQVVLREPVPDVGRHQKRLLAITRDKALAHHQMVMNPPDDPDLRDSLA